MTVESRLREIVIELLEVEADDVTLEADLRKSLEADSLALMEILQEIDEEWAKGNDVIIDDDTAQTLKTFGDAVVQIQKYLNAQ
ncbi:MAG: acyl carrier protein [Candidatus Promineifilaceae bacterium]